MTLIFYVIVCPPLADDSTPPFIPPLPRGGERGGEKILLMHRNAITPEGRLAGNSEVDKKLTNRFTIFQKYIMKNVIPALALFCQEKQQ
jgi:hypothetical protein